MYELKVEKIEGFADGLVSCSVWNLQWGDTQIVLAMGLLYAVSKGGRCLTAYSQGLWGKNKTNKQKHSFLNLNLVICSKLNPRIKHTSQSPEGF